MPKKQTTSEHETQSHDSQSQETRSHVTVSVEEPKQIKGGKKQATKTATKPTTKTATKQATKPATKTVAKTATKPATKTATKPATKAVAKKPAAKKTATKKAVTKKPAAKKTTTKKTATKKAVTKKTTGGDKVEEDGGKKSRYFKVVKDDGQTMGRFSGSKPKQAANKALTSILKELRTNNKPTVGEFAFKIKECTRGSRCKEYSYVGQRKELDEPLEVPLKGILNKDGTIKTIKYSFENIVRKAPKVVEEVAET